MPLQRTLRCLYGVLLPAMAISCIVGYQLLQLDILHESFTVRLPNPAAPPITTSIHAGWRQVCFTTAGVMDCTSAFSSGSAFWWRFNATQHGLSILGDDGSTDPPTTVYTGSSANTYGWITPIASASYWCATAFILAGLTVYLYGVPTEPDSDREWHVNFDRVWVPLLYSVLQFGVMFVSASKLSGGVVRLVGDNPNFRLCEGCATVDYKYGMLPHRLSMVWCIVVLDAIALCLCCVQARLFGSCLQRRESMTPVVLDEENDAR